MPVHLGLLFSFSYLKGKTTSLKQLSYDSPNLVEHVETNFNLFGGWNRHQKNYFLSSQESGDSSLSSH